MAKKSYAYAQLEAVALEMRRNKEMCFFYEYQAPVATLSTGEVLDLAKEFGVPRTSGRGWAIDEAWIVGAAIGVAAAGSPAIARTARDGLASSPSSTSTTRLENCAR